ncbi:MAG: hypothetical protein ABR502_12290 [Chitinophagaceae bacterium]
MKRFLNSFFGILLALTGLYYLLTYFAEFAAWFSIANMSVLFQWEWPITYAFIVVSFFAALYVSFAPNWIDVNQQKLIGVLEVIIRFSLSVILINYSLAKLQGTQFFSSSYALDQPMVTARGLDIAWRFFEYSKLVGYFIAATQFVGALLLLFRRTKLLAALLLLPIFTNIVLIDIGFGINALHVAISCWLMCIYIALQDFSLLQNLFWYQTNPISIKRENIYSPLSNRLSLPVKLIFLTIAFIFSFYSGKKLVDTYLAPSVLNGVWQVQDNSLCTDSIFGARHVDTVRPRLYFEGKMDGSVAMGGKRKRFLFTLDPQTDSIKFQFRNKETPFAGIYYLNKSNLILKGSRDSETINLKLVKIR